MKSKNGANKPTKDSKKEKIFKILTEIVTGAGLTVRREELKRGFGWKAVSGTCRLDDSKILFIDRRMTQEDQVSFLSSKIVALGIVPTSEQATALAELGWSLGGSEAPQAQTEDRI